jgi:Fic family protein
VQGGSYSPQKDPSPWIGFCVEAHLQQAEERLVTIRHAAERWTRLEELAESHNWDDRLVIAMEQALSSKTDRASYGTEAGVSTATASNDLRRLVDSGYLVRRGKGRSTTYSASESLRQKVSA